MAVAVRSLEAEAYPHSAVDSGTGQCGGPKCESDAPVAILGETCCVVSDGTLELLPEKNDCLDVAC